MIEQFIIGITELYIFICEALIKRIPYRNKLCWLFGHLYPGVYLKKEFAGLEYPEMIVADTESGCVYCGKQTKNCWSEHELDRK